jgi:hypothetical protein
MRALGLALVFLLPAQVSAQNWSAEERSLIEAIEACWAQAATDPSFEGFVEACRPTDETVYWWTPETTPFSVTSSWVRQAREAWQDVAIAQDLRPLRVRIDGEFGFIFLHGIRIWEAADRSQRTESWRGYEVWRRTADGWSFHSGMGAPDDLNQSD